jgi:Fe2+ transport system protein FeoA
MSQNHIGEYPEAQNRACTAGSSAAIPVKKIISITSLGNARKGTIAYIRGDGSVVQRLVDLGLTVGTTVAILRKAPLGGPVGISVRYTTLAVDSTIAKNIFIEVPAPGDP